MKTHKVTNSRFEGLYILFIFTLIFVIFRRAFEINFILDDFIFLKLGKLHSINDFFHIFSPFKTFFYRPFPTEIFYFFINKINNNLFFSHLTVFIFYCIGLFFLYKCLWIITKKAALSRLIVFLYAIHLTHVFQLYELATFIEVSLFSFLTLSLYFYLTKRPVLSLLFFVSALLSKETAMFLPVFILLLHIFNIWKLPSKKFIIITPYILLSVIAFTLYRPSLAYLQSTEPLYTIRLSPKLIGNNLMWYGLWSLGFPNFLPDYFTSIFAKPLPKFWSIFNEVEYKIFFTSIIAYYVLISITSIKLLLSKQKDLQKLLLAGSFLGASFLLFIGPTLPTIHKWMVRLTVPLIFVSVIQSFIIYFAYEKKGIWRCFSFLLVALYFVIQITGIPIHEKSSVYLLQSAISTRMQNYCLINKDTIQLKSSIYFIDKVDRGLWGGSQMLRNTLHESDFLDAFCPKEIKKAYFNYKYKNIPKNTYVIDSVDIISR